MEMLNKKIVHEALKRSLAADMDRISAKDKLIKGHDSIISLLIHDIFGGDILKTHCRKRWHFYNRIEGERVDFTGSEVEKSPEMENFEDIPATPDETYDYFDIVDYSTFFVRFIRSFEEVIGLERFRPEYNM
jgi:hypothetical protein